MKLVTMIPVGNAELEEACRAVASIDLIRITDPAALPDAVRDADCLVVGSIGYTAGVAGIIRQHATRLRLLQFASTGFETAVIHGVPDGVVVANTGSAWAPIVAEHTLALILGLLRRIHEAERDRAAARWRRPELVRTVASLEGAHLVIVGFGNIGREVARRARVFGARITGVARHLRDDMLADRMVGGDRLAAVLPEADILVLATPMNISTANLIGAKEFSLLKPGALLINIARGGVVAEAALADALTSGRLAGAGLDVFETEPLPPDSPLWGLPNVILTQHVAGMGSPIGFVRMAEIIRDNAIRLAAGHTPLYVVDLSP
jgi:phosphoglycerate dehydrogenase-like enzyme